MAKEKWEIDPAQTSIGFSVRHMMFSKVRGRFKVWQVDLDLDLDDLTQSSVDVSVDASSIDTADELRDRELRSANFLDVERHPSLRFKSELVERRSAATFRIVGGLQIRGVARPFTLDTELRDQRRDASGREKLAFNAGAKLQRKDFGLVFNQALEAGGVLVGDTVEIHIEAEARRAS